MNIITWIQQFSSLFLDIFFNALTILGEETLGIAIFIIVFWTMNKDYGYKLLFAYLTSMSLNGCTKDFFKAPRPIGTEGIRSLRTKTATGYSFPSGHTQGTTTLWTSLSIIINKVWFYILCGSIIILVGLSRLYLGVHWPKDVLFGIIFGILSVLLSNYIYVKGKEKNNPYLFLYILIPLLISLIFFNSTDSIKAIAGFSGAFIGYILEIKYINFTIPKNMYKKVIRLLSGIIIILFIKSGLKFFLPNMALFHFIRYFILTFFIVFLGPLIFKKLKT